MLVARRQDRHPCVGRPVDLSEFAGTKGSDTDAVEIDLKPRVLYAMHERRCPVFRFFYCFDVARRKESRGAIERSAIALQQINVIFNTFIHITEAPIPALLMAAKFATCHSKSCGQRSQGRFWAEYAWRPKADLISEVRLLLVAGLYDQASR